MKKFLLIIQAPVFPKFSNFIKFWDQCITENTNEFYLEIEEILNLFKNFSGKSCSNINEDEILNLIKHFYPDIIIENNKYILCISCTLWDKKKELSDFLDLIKLESHNINSDNLYNQYLDYNKKTSKKNKFPIINKNYFELFLNDSLKN